MLIVGFISASRYFPRGELSMPKIEDPFAFLGKTARPPVLQNRQYGGMLRARNLVIEFDKKATA
jgi:hypothetical protein